MAAPSARRPLPALVFLLGLSLLTALVWWRVIHRADAQSTPKSSATTCAAKPHATVLPQPKSVTLEVLNSTNRLLLAAHTKTALTALGFVVSGINNDETGTVPGVAEIRYGPAGMAGAQLVSYYIPGSTLVNTGAAGAQVVVSLGTKFTTTATAAAAKAAMTAAHVSQSPATTARPTPTHASTSGGARSSTSATSTATC